MNRFITADTVERCAKDLCDAHLHKMVLEEGQMLCTTIHEQWRTIYADLKQVVPLYKPTHVNHPCRVWAGESADNFRFAYSLFSAMCDEYTRRRNRVHKTDQDLRIALRLLVNQQDFGRLFDKQELTRHPQCMPDEFKTDEFLPVTAYRNYMKKHKATVMTMRWSAPASAPIWFN